jgi:hypothetical protein
MATKKITKATPEQWARIDELRQRVIDGITDQPSDESVREVVRKMWARMDKTPAAVVIADCPIVGAIFMSMLAGAAGQKLDSQLYSQLYSQLHSQLDSQLRSQLGSQLYSQLYSQLRSQLGSQLGSQLYSQLYSQLDSQLRSQLRSQLDSQLGSQLYSQLDSQLYVSVYWRAWSGWYEGGHILGVEFDSDAFALFLQWSMSVPVIYANTGIPVVSRFPSSVKWRDGLLHCEDGKAVEFRSGWGLYSIGGIPVDEQIVMRPESQTVDQIDKEQNNDVRSIRIERFGWARYLKESGAECRCERLNAVSNTPEAIYRTRRGEQRFVVGCSTGRLFSLGLPPEIETCEQAQSWLGPQIPGLKLNPIGAT